MSQPAHLILLQQEGRVQLALRAYHAGQFRSHRCAAAAYNVDHQRLSDRDRGIPFRLETPPNGRKLTLTEEQTIVEYILDLDQRGFPPRKCEVIDMADKLLAARGGEPVGKKWVDRFITRSDKLKMTFNRAKDRQRIVKGYYRKIQRLLARDSSL